MVDRLDCTTADRAAALTALRLGIRRWESISFVTFELSLVIGLLAYKIAK